MGENVRSKVDRLGALRQIFASTDLRHLIPWLGITTLLGNIFALALPLAILQILDRVIHNQSIETLVLLVIGVVFAVVLEVVLRTTGDLTTRWLGARFEHNSSVAALQRLVRVPLQRYQQEEPGSYAERVLASTKVAEFYSGQALLVLFDFPFVVIFLYLIFHIGGWLVCVPLLLLIIFGFLVYYAGNWMQRPMQEREKVNSRRLGFLNEVLTGIHAVKTQMMESLLLRRHERMQRTNSELTETLTRGTSSAALVGNVFGQVMILSVVFAGSAIVMAGDMTPGGLAACMLLSVRALQPLRRAMDVWMKYQSFVVSNERLNHVMKLPYETDIGKPPISPIRDALELRGVNFSYTSGKTIFSNLNLTLKAGEFIAISGESGSGKTSLLTFMNGMLRPDSGAVLVDGRPLDGYLADSVYKEIALLPQQGAIVPGTVLENLTMFDSSLNQEALRIAARLGLDRSVSRMKMGYETQLSEGNSETIPVGMWQVIVIVRALVHQPSVILFDEANTSLDMYSDQLLRDYLAEQKGRCCAVLVTPRPSLISLADKVYVLADGRLIEDTDAGHTREFSSPSESRPLPPRPQGSDDLEIVIQRQFSQASDLSICLQPLLSALSWKGNARELAEAMPHLVQTLDLSNLCSIMSNLGLVPKHLTCDLLNVNTRFMPCLFVPANQCAKVVLGQLPNGKLRIFDSATKTEAEITPTSIKGKIYLFQREDPKENSIRSQGSWVGSLIWRMRMHLALVLGLSLVGAVLSLATPLFVRMTYDTVLPSGDMAMATYMVLGVLMVIVLDGTLRNLKGRVLAFMAGRLDYVLSNGMFSRIINLPTVATEGSSVSHQVGRLRNLERLRDFFLGPLAFLAFELPATVVLLIAIAVINPYVLLVLLCSGVTFALLGYWSRKSVGRATDLAGHWQNTRWEFLNETLTDMRSIRLVGAAQVWVDRFRDLSGKSIMANFRDQKVQARTNGLTRIVGSLTGLLGLATSAYLVINGQITGGTMVATMLILWRVTGPVENLFMSSTSIAQTKTNIEQIDRLMKMKGESDIGVSKTLVDVVKGAINFSRVSFRYTADADPALLGISFVVEPGQMLIVTGNMGSGKSSIIKLIERAYLPQAGTIRLDSADIRQLTARDLRSNISYMPQHCELFYGSVAQNLLLVHPSASDAELMWAVEMAGLAADIAALPEGFKTQISNSRSEQLPHGFKQRLSLARVMLKPAAVVLLDEPGAGMDRIGDESLLRCIEWLRGRSTIIMVSHRPGHMKLADNVILLRQGSIVASGAYESIKNNILSEML